MLGMKVRASYSTTHHDEQKRSRKADFDLSPPACATAAPPLRSVEPRAPAKILL